MNTSYRFDIHHAITWLYMTCFHPTLPRYEKYPFQKVLDEVGIDMSASVYALVIDGLQLISKWTAQVSMYTMCVVCCV